VLDVEGQLERTGGVDSVNDLQHICRVVRIGLSEIVRKNLPTNSSRSTPDENCGAVAHHATGKTS
jgi:hypothetical protein